jgi:hypothetical protein
MSVASFIPKLWAAALETPYQDALVYGQLADNKFQPLLQNSGNSIEINTIGSAAIHDHDRNKDLSYDDLSTTAQTLLIDQEDYYGFRVNDVDELQAAGDLQTDATEQHGIAMANKVDTYLAGQLAKDAGKKLTGLTAFDGADFYRPATGQTTAWDTIRAIVKELDKVSAPSLARWAVVGADFASALLADRRVTDASVAGTDTVARSGQVAAIQHLGITVYVSNNAPVKSGAEVITAGVPGALAFVSQLRTIEAFRDPNRFGDIVRGLQVYGGKVIRPKGIVSAEVKTEPGNLGGSTGGGAEGNG